MGNGALTTEGKKYLFQFNEVHFVPKALKKQFEGFGPVIEDPSTACEVSFL